MKIKLTTLLFGLLLAVGWTSNAFAQSTTFTAESIKDLRYEWTDAAGTTHSEPYVKYDEEKQAWLAPEVTNAYQIYGLLRGVYMEKKLPGPWQSAFAQNGDREDDIYYGGAKNGWDIPGTHVSGGTTSTIGSLRVQISNGDNGYQYTPARILALRSFLETTLSQVGMLATVALCLGLLVLELFLEIPQPTITKPGITATSPIVVVTLLFQQVKQLDMIT